MSLTFLAAVQGTMLADSGLLAFQLIVALVCGIITAAIASGKGRSGVGWFFVGFLTGIIGIIIAACMSNLKQEQAYRMQTQIEQRRLQEQLRQERMKTETMRQYTMTRLDMHDHTLGVDTRGQNALPGAMPTDTLQLEQDPNDPAAALEQMGGIAQPPVRSPLSGQPGQYPGVGAAQTVYSVPEPGAPSPASGEATQWYYHAHGKNWGPVSENMIMFLFNRGQLNGKTLLWASPMASWVALEMVDPFSQLVRSKA